MQPGDNVFGYDLNRITTALNGFRSGLVTLVGPTIETNFDPVNLGGVLINNSGIKVIADGTQGIPIGTVVWNSQNTGQFTTAQFFPVYSGYQQVDGTYRCRVRFRIPTTVTKLVKILLSFTLQPFHVGNQTTAVANTSAGGAAHSHTVTIGDHSHTTPNHNHELFDYVSSGNAMPATYELYVAKNSGGSNINVGFVGSSSTVNVWTPVTSGSATSGNGGATTPTSSNESTHTHAIPSLSLNAPSAIYEAGMAQGVHVYIDNGSGLVDQTTPLGGPWGSGSALDVSDKDITTYITGTGWKEIQFSSTTIGGVTAQAVMQWIGNAI